MKKLISNFKNLFKKILFLDKSKLIDSADKYDEVLDSFELDILWEDIRESTYSIDNNIITRCMKRNGFHGVVSPCLIILDSGATYVPQELSQHWECYNNSLKTKPINIKYIKL
jgi:hypothetical protein